VTTPSDDPLVSHHLGKIARAGLQPRRTIEDAVRELCVAFRENRLPKVSTTTLFQRQAAAKIESSMNGKPIAVVTGGAASSSHMVDLLLDVILRCVIDLSGGREANSAHHAQNSDLACHWRDIRMLAPGDPIFSDCRYVFHFAGIGDIVPSIERPIEYMDINVQGTVRALECARAAKVKKFVYAASSSCYGLAATPTREDHPIAPQYPYALSKYQGEQAVFHWGNVYRPCQSICIFNAYGMRVHHGRIWLSLASSSPETAAPHTVVGDGRNHATSFTQRTPKFLAAAE
jgi:UDP-glucose 4-epimerase